MTKNKGSSSLALIIIAVLILGGGYWVWQGQLGSPTSKSAPAPVADTNIEPPVPSTPSVDMADWKTYRNEEYGFEFEYPQDFNLCTGQGLFDDAYPFNELICLRNEDSSYVLAARKALFGMKTEEEFLNLNSYSGEKVMEEFIGPNKFLVIRSICVSQDQISCTHSHYDLYNIFGTNSGILIFSKYDSTNSIGNTDQILSTFRFIEWLLIKNYQIKIEIMPTITLNKTEYQELKKKAKIYDAFWGREVKIRRMIPVIYLQDKSAKKLDRRVIRSLRDYKLGRTKTINSLSDIQ